jgi:hypothetical protein
MTSDGPAYSTFRPVLFSGVISVKRQDSLAPLGISGNIWLLSPVGCKFMKRRVLLRAPRRFDCLEGTVLLHPPETPGFRGP